MNPCRSPLLLALLPLFAFSLPAQEEKSSPTSWGNWISWRGFASRGLAENSNPPIEWSETKNVRWKAEIPGRSLSTPIVLANWVYLLTAVPSEREGEATNLEPANPRSNPPPTVEYDFFLLALDRGDGKEVWKTLLATAIPHEGGHASSSQASSSPVTDGEHVFVNLGSRGIHCVDLAGEVVWSRDLGLMRTRHQYGEGSSPVLFGDKLIVNRDQEGESFLHVLDKISGEDVWQVARDEETNWTTPLVVLVEGQPQIVVAAHNASRGYDLETGESLWTLPGMTKLCIPSPMHAEGIVYLMSGYPGSSLQALRLTGAKGDMSGSESLLWTHERNTAYVSSPLLYEDRLYFVRVVNGVLSCLDAKTGEVRYEGQKMPGMRRVVSSIVGGGGRVYITSQNGTTKVVKHGDVYEELASNKLEDEFEASPAIAGGELYLRGHRYLYCIAEG